MGAKRIAALIVAALVAGVVLGSLGIANAGGTIALPVPGGADCATCPGETECAEPAAAAPVDPSACGAECTDASMASCPGTQAQP